MQVVKAIKFGFRWQMGDGRKIRFGEDTWFGTSPLAVQFWPLYIICNEQTKTAYEVCGDQQATFRRNLNAPLMEQWFQLDEIAKSVSLLEDTDCLIWQLRVDNKGHYSSSSLYHVINFRAVQPVYVPAVWKLRFMFFHGCFLIIKL